MIVEGVRTTRLCIPYPEPPNFAGTPVPDRDLLLVEVDTDTGISGMGYLQPLAGGLRTLATCIEEVLTPLLVGQPVTSHDGHVTPPDRPGHGLILRPELLERHRLA